MTLSPGAAIGIGLGSLVAGLVVYEALCRSPLDENGLAIALLVVFGFVAWGLTQVFSGRGAFIHFGAILGTIMAANVAHIIIPGQRELVRAKQEGREPDPKYGLAGKQRSVHNTYFTLPVIFTMISGHHAMTFGTRWNWLVLIAMALAGALIRLWFVARHKGTRAGVDAGRRAVRGRRGDGGARRRARRRRPRRSASSRSSRSSISVASPATPRSRCSRASPRRRRASSSIRRSASRRSSRMIHQQTVLTRAMPPGNITRMTDAERALLDRWVRIK